MPCAAGSSTGAATPAKKRRMGAFSDINFIFRVSALYEGTASLGGRGSSLYAFNGVLTFLKRTSAEKLDKTNEIDSG